MIAAVDHLEGEVDRGRSTGTANPKAAGAAVAAEAAMAVGAAGAVASGSGSELPWLVEPISLSLSVYFKKNYPNHMTNSEMSQIIGQIAKYRNI